MSGSYYSKWYDCSGSIHGTLWSPDSYALQYEHQEIHTNDFVHTECPYCGNDSGLRDNRGMCIGCGGRLNAK